MPRTTNPPAPPREQHEAARCCSIWILPASEVGTECPVCSGARHLDDCSAGERERRQRVCRPCQMDAARRESRRAAVGEAATHPTDTERIARVGAARAALRRRLRNYRSRPIEWAPWAATVADQLAELSPAVEVVYLLGPRPERSAAGVLAWSLGELPDGWRQSPRGHYLAAAPVLRYQREDGAGVELHHAGGWLGDDTERDPDACAEGWQLAGDLIEHTFDRGHLLTTAAATGRHLIERSVPFGREWPAMSDELVQLVRATTGQGRVELFDQAAGELPELVKVDARLAYGALCWGLPAGEPVRDTLDVFAGQHRARYEVDVTVPASWAGPGLLPHQLDAGGWEWPAEPGRTFTSWVDGSELLIAQQQGWAFTIRQRIVWPHYTHRGPLDSWADKLIACRQAVADRHAVGAISTEVAAVAGAILRAVLLHAIGGLHGAGTRVTRVGSEPPMDAKGARLHRATGLYTWTADERPAEHPHPEWSAAIWARCRARLLSAPTGTAGVRAGLLHLPAGIEAVAARVDALYLTGDPRWPDDGKVGRYRRQQRRPGPLPAPANQAELLAMMGGTDG